jgi:hypothetical protein
MSTERNGDSGMNCGCLGEAVAGRRGDSRKLRVVAKDGPDISWRSHMPYRRNGVTNMLEEEY